MGFFSEMAKIGNMAMVSTLTGGHPDHRINAVVLVRKGRQTVTLPETVRD